MSQSRRPDSTNLYFIVNCKLDFRFLSSSFIATLIDIWNNSNGYNF